MYLSTARFLWPSMTIIIRGDERAQAAALLRRTVREMDPQLAVYNVRQMDELIDQSAAQPRLNASLIALFAVVAALLAAIGIYGVLAYLVSQRTQEIGIRMALGAGRPAVLRLFLTRGLWLALGGLVAGVLGSIAVSRWVGSLLFEMRARDPWTIAAATARGRNRGRDRQLHSRAKSRRGSIRSSRCGRIEGVPGFQAGLIRA